MTAKRLWAKVWPFLPAAGWYAVITALSAQTGSESSEMSDSVATQLFELGLLNGRGGAAAWMELVTFLLRKGAHMGAYFLLAALLLFALRRVSCRPLFQGLWALGLCGAMAGLDEFHQTFVPGRSGQLRDVLIDLSGAAVCVLLWAGLCLLRKKHRKRGQARPENAEAKV